MRSGLLRALPRSRGTPPIPGPIQIPVRFRVPFTAGAAVSVREGQRGRGRRERPARPGRRGNRRRGCRVPAWSASVPVTRSHPSTSARATTASRPVGEPPRASFRAVASADLASWWHIPVAERRTRAQAARSSSEGSGTSSPVSSTGPDARRCSRLTAPPRRGAGADASFGSPVCPVRANRHLPAAKKRSPGQESVHILAVGPHHDAHLVAQRVEEVPADSARAVGRVDAARRGRRPASMERLHALPSKVGRIRSSKGPGAYWTVLAASSVTTRRMSSQRLGCRR